MLGVRELSLMDPPPIQQRPRVLVVEDDQELCVILKEFLDERGFNAITLSCGHAASDWTSKHVCRAAIIDLRLPGLSGWHLIHQLNQKNIPVLVLSSHDSVSAHRLARQLGAARYLTKPFDLPHLERSINELLLKRMRSFSPLRCRKI